MAITTADLETFLAASGITLSASADLTRILAVAKDRWEEATGWRPWVASASTARYFDAPRNTSVGQTLYLDAGLLTCSEVKVGVGMDGAGGSALTLGTGYVLEPYAGPPYSRIELFGAPGGRRSVKVTGTWGREADYGGVATEAVLCAAAATVVRENMGGIGPTTRVRQGQVEVEYDAEAGRGAYDRLNARFHELAKAHRRTAF